VKREYACQQAGNNLAIRDAIGRTGDTQCVDTSDNKYLTNEEQSRSEVPDQRMSHCRQHRLGEKSLFVAACEARSKDRVQGAC
jgi:hypothetical protein